MVQTSAAYALRMVLSRRQDAAPAGRKLLIAALKSPNARTRWGATRVFNQHFKELTGDPDLLAALESDLNDPVPFVRFQAASGLWRWYYWQVDQQPVRRSTLEALATRLNTETESHGAPRPRGEHLRSARREHRLPGSVGASQFARMRTRTASGTATKR